MKVRTIFSFLSFVCGDDFDKMGKKRKKVCADQHIESYKPSNYEIR